MTWSKPSPRRRKAIPPRRIAARPTIEIVEDRTLLASHLVSTGIGTGLGSLYAAIEAANLDGSGAANIIQFGSGVTIVQLDTSTPLPELTREVTIDGGSGVVIDGDGGSFDGFRFATTAASSVVHGLTIQNLDGAAIVIRADSVTVRDNTFGDASGAVGHGVLIDGSSSSAAANSIHDNVIGFATAAGVEVSGAQASGNLIFGNRIGTDGAGGDRGNAVGVLISGSPSNQVGVGGANTIGFNTDAGVRITGAGATGNVVQSNLIGVDGSGNAIGNPIGIDVAGVGAGPATIIAQNSVDASSTAGVRIGGGATGVQVRSNLIGVQGTTPERKNAIGVLVTGAVGNVVGGEGTGNTIVLAATAGVELRSTGAATGNVVSGNLIGTDATGAELGSPIGVLIDGSAAATAANRVGGTAAGAANTIGFSSTAGVRILGANATGNTVAGNLIGVTTATVAGLAAGNAIGVEVSGGRNNTIGGTTAAAANQVGFSATAGVRIAGTGATGNVVSGNRIGTNAGGLAMGNPIGVEVAGAGVGANTIGGTAAGAGNLIDVASTAGVRVGDGATGVLVRGNTIGSLGGATGYATDIGVLVEAAEGNAIGGNMAGAANVIVRATTAGVVLRSTGSGAGGTGNVVSGNLIGTDAAGASLGNPIGVWIDGRTAAAAGNMVGGTAAGDANTIGFSSTAGVRVEGSNATGNTVAGNLIGVDRSSNLIGNSYGVQIVGAASNVVGGPIAAAANSIDATTNAAVSITGATATNNRVQANLIGLKATAAAASRNSDGILINGAGAGNTIGGADDAGNTIGNAISAAIRAFESMSGGSIVGNYIGVRRDGSAIPNPTGIGIFDSRGFAVGAAGQRNYIANSTVAGVSITGATATNNLVVANTIGATAGGAAAGNSYGVLINGAGGNTIGGETAAAANTIVAATSAGIRIQGTTAGGNSIYGNFIGRTSGGAGMGNQVGVVIDGSDGNRIGGVAAGRGNTVGSNTFGGVAVLSGAGNLIVGNAFMGTNGIGTPTSVNDIILSPGANENATPPKVVSASITTTGGENTLTMLFSAPIPASTSTIQVYQLDASGNRLYVTSAAVSASTPNTLVITDFALANAAGLLVTMTLETDSTSPFSNSVPVADLFVVKLASAGTVDDVSSLAWVIQNVNTQPLVEGGRRIRFDLPTGVSTITVLPTQPLPSVLNPIMIDVSSTIRLVQGGVGSSPIDGLVLDVGSNTSLIKGLTFSNFAGAGLRVRSNSNVVQSNGFTGNGFGLVIEGNHNDIGGSAATRNTFTDSLSAGIQISGGNATQNKVRNNRIANNPVGVAIVGGGINQIGGEGEVDDGHGNVIEGNALQGVSILSGDDNSILWNSFNANGPAIANPGDALTYSAANNIVLAPLANRGIQPATALSATFSPDLNAPSDPTRATLSIFAQTDRSFASPAALPEFQVYINKIERDVSGHVTSSTLVLVTRPVDVERAEGYTDRFILKITGVLVGQYDRVLVVTTVQTTESLAPTTRYNTSAFSNDIKPQTPNVVVNTLNIGEGSLRNAIAYAKLFPTTRTNIYFRIGDYRNPAGPWRIGLVAPLDVTANVCIDGRNTYEGFNPDTATSYVAPSVILMPAVEGPGASTGLTFKAGSAGSFVWSLGFEGFASAGVRVDASDVSILGSVFTGRMAPASATGEQPVPTGWGVWISQDGAETKIGDATRPAAYNTFDHLSMGILIQGAGSNKVEGNRIGVAPGNYAFSNGDGVVIQGSPSNRIYGNLIGNSHRSDSLSAISATRGAGVFILSAGAFGNTIARNSIGVLTDIVPSGQAGNDVGIDIEFEAGANHIGSIAPSSDRGDWNTIGANGYGIRIRSASNTVAGNYIGTDESGVPHGNTTAGVALLGPTAVGNKLGDVSRYVENVIGWNALGILLDEGARSNMIRNNFVGTTRLGAAIPNTTGVTLWDARNNVLGPIPGVDVAPSPLDANLYVGANFISGNITAGIALGRPAAPAKDVVARTSTGNLIVGNLIGGGQVGAVRFQGNGGSGVLVAQSRSDEIGGESILVGDKPDSLAVGRANRILGNKIGVEVRGDTSSSTVIVGNQISANLLQGIYAYAASLDGAEKNLAFIRGNFIGTTFDGKSTRVVGSTGQGPAGEPTGNGLDGVRIELVAGETTSAPAPRTWAVVVAQNLVSGNGLNGVAVGQAGSNGTDRIAFAKVLIAGNVIGLNVDGLSGDVATGLPYGNTLDGVRIYEVGGVQVGEGLASGWSNVISGNLGRGVEVFWTKALGDIQPDVIRVNVQGNIIGASLDGTQVDRTPTSLPTGNLSDGVFLYGDVVANILTNLVAGNRAAGVHTYDASPESFTGRLLIRGNLVGTDREGRDLNNGADGIFIDQLNSFDRSKPTDSPDAYPIRASVVDNLIGNNRGNGIHVFRSAGVTITSNTIGDFMRTVDGRQVAAGAGNASNGVLLNASSRITVGGADFASGNLISGNLANGVAINLNGRVDAFPNYILGNRIGTTGDGTGRLGNQNSGVLVNGSDNNRIGLGDSPEFGGNVISGNRLYGVLIVGASGNHVAGNLIGSDVTGKAALPNSADGVFLLDSTGNRIGSDGMNVISGNDAQGIRIFGDKSRGNDVVGNLIGLGIDGSTRVANKGNGILVDNAGANRIGVAGARPNVISGNDQSGILVSSTTTTFTGTTIVGNYIGTDATATNPAPNRANGVFLFGASGVTVDDNVVSSNFFDGVQIFSPSRNAYADSNILLRNKIGVDKTGTRAIGNNGNGVSIINGFGNLIGFGGASGPGRNIISGNANGVAVDVQAGYGGSDDPGTLGAPNQISGNIIGLDATGEADLGNRYAGVLLNNAVGTIVGHAIGFTAEDVDARLLAYTVAPGPEWASNVVSGNGHIGVYLTGRTRDTKVRGNYIGTDIRGRTYGDDGRGLDLSSDTAAVLVDSGASYNWIGGVASNESIPVAGTGNLITQSRSASVGDSSIVGVRINSIGAVGNHVQSNVIGLDATGRSGSNRIGVLLDNATGTTIGGYGDARNVITGNAVAGVEINGPLATRNAIFNNSIGTHGNGTTRPAPRDPSGIPGYDPSQQDGVLILQSSGNSVGYPGLGNLISGNGDGVNIASLDSNAPAAGGNYVVGNRIGTDQSGMKAVPNFRTGVFITASPDTQIVGNLISANGLAGVQIFGGRGQQGGQGNAAALGTTIVGNTIGLNAAGKVAFSPSNGTTQINPASDFPAVRLPDGITINLNAQQHGVVVIGASGNRIGLPGDAGRNTISGNTLTGVYISKLDNTLQSFATPVDNVVQNNSLQTNGIYGVFRYDAPNNPAVEAPSANANDFAGTPIPIGDFITGLNTQTPSNPAESILLGNAPKTPTQPGRGRNRRPRATPQAPVAPARPALIQRPGMAQAARALSR